MIRPNLINTAFIASAAGWENVDGSFLLQLLIIVTAGATLATMVLGWFKKTPPDTEKFRHADECDKRCSQNLSAHEKIERAMDERLSSMSGHSANSRKEIYARLVRVENELAAIKKENEIQTQRIIELSSKFDRFLERKGTC